MTDSTALLVFKAKLWPAKARLTAALRAAGYAADGTATVRGLVRLARTMGCVEALAEFETDIRSAVVEYIAAVPRGQRDTLPADVQFLRDHFDRFTEVPMSASPVKRVLTWLRRHYRAWRKAHGHVH